MTAFFVTYQRSHNKDREKMWIEYVVRLADRGEADDFAASLRQGDHRDVVVWEGTVCT